MVVPSQDRLVHPPQLLAGLHAQLVQEPAPRLPVEVQRLGLAPAAVQRAHPQSGERLVVRLGQGRRHQGVQGLRVAPEQHQALRPVLEHGASLPGEAFALGAGERTGQAGQRLTAEQLQGTAAPHERRVEVTGGLRAVDAADLFGEVAQVGRHPLGHEAVAAVPAADHRPGGPRARDVQRLAQGVDVARQDPVARTGGFRSPYVVQQLPVRHEGRRPQDQGREDGLPSYRAECERHRAPTRADRPEQVDPHLPARTGPARGRTARIRTHAHVKSPRPPCASCAPCPAQLPRPCFSGISSAFQRAATEFARLRRYRHRRGAGPVAR